MRVKHASYLKTGLSSSICSSLPVLIVGGVYTCETGLELERLPRVEGGLSMTELEDASLVTAGTSFLVTKSSGEVSRPFLIVLGDP